MGHVVILGVFVADTAYRADRMPRMGETILGNSFVLGPGGKGSNQAVAAGRMGAQVSIISRLGQDDFAKMALDVWKQSGVKPYVKQSSSDYTGAAYIFIEESSGDNAIIIAPGAAAKITPADLQDQTDLISNADVFVTQLEQPMEAAMKGLEIAKSAGVKTILNPAPAADLPNGMLELCDFITPNETETEAITGVSVSSIEDAENASRLLVKMGVGTPIITLGEKGAYLYGHGLVEPFSVGPVLETTGAGDAFNGGFATALSEGVTALEAVTVGCATAGISVTRAGTAPSMPTRSQVDKLIRR
ncbi:MAG: ribokinase [Pseudomonadota bacterium]|nr:ribokinase [Pseudomonadota bacterium]